MDAQDRVQLARRLMELQQEFDQKTTALGWKDFERGGYQPRGLDAIAAEYDEVLSKYVSAVPALR